MNIVVISWRDLANPLAGGSEVVIDQILLGLAERGHDVTLVCGGPVGRRPYRVIEAGHTYSQYFRVPLAVIRSCRNADVIIDTENGIPFFSPLWWRKSKVCLVHHLHVNQWADRFPPLLACCASFVEKTMMPKIYRDVPFVAVSNSTKVSLEEIGVASNRISVIESGVTIPDRSKMKLSNKSERPLFVCIGRQVPHKRTMIVLAAWSLIVRDTDGELLIIGDGPENQEITKMAKSIPRVKMLGWVEEQVKTDLLSSSWMQVSATRHEGWGVSVLEAAAVGTPTIAFDVAGIRDSIIHNTTGVLVQESKGSEAEDLAHAWKALARDSLRLHSLSRSSYLRACNQAWEDSINRWEKLLLTVADKSRQ